MTQAYTGGCACGGIHYETPDEPLAMLHCQCRDCQRKSGTGHSSYLVFPRAGVKLSGAASHWDMIADSGNTKTRGFCPKCGSPVYVVFPANAGIFAIHAASLDDPGRFQPQFVTYAGRGHAWDKADPALTKFERMPTR